MYKDRIVWINKTRLFLSFLRFSLFSKFWMTRLTDLSILNNLLSLIMLQQDSRIIRSIHKPSTYMMITIHLCRNMFMSKSLLSCRFDVWVRYIISLDLEDFVAYCLSHWSHIVGNGFILAVYGLVSAERTKFRVLGVFKGACLLILWISLFHNPPHKMKFQIISLRLSNSLVIKLITPRCFVNTILHIRSDWGSQHATSSSGIHRSFSD